MDTDTTTTAPPLPEIYQQLKRGQGHQWVNDDNVFDLIKLAKNDGNRLIEVTLREWQAPCKPAEPRPGERPSE